MTTDSDAHKMDFLFLLTGGGNEAAKGDFVAVWNCRWSYEVNVVGAGEHAGADTLGESAKVVGVGADPDSFVYTAAEVMVSERLSGLGINDGVGSGAVGTGLDQITRGSRIVGIVRNDVRVGPGVCMVPKRSETVRRWVSRGGDELWWSHPRN